MFDFKKGLKDSQAAMNDKHLAAVILGPSGGGKSFLCGTMGVKTLYLYMSGESHGPVSAKVTGGANVDAYCLDIYDGKILTADQTYDHLLAVLSDQDNFKGYKAVVLDGASELESVIRNSSKLIKEITTDKGGRNAFAIPAATVSLFRPVLNALKSLQRNLGLHYAVTCILDVKSLGSDGEILESTPRLQGYSVAESLVQHFDDVLVVGRMSRDDVVKHKIQFGSNVTKVSKSETGVVKKAVNYNPRISGLGVSDLPPMMDADLSEVIALKTGKKGV